MRAGRVLPAAVLLLCGPGGVGAEDLAAARACAAIAADGPRLACYDQAFGVAPRPPEARFGDTGQLQGKKAADTAPTSVSATVETAVALAEGLYRLSLDNGQVWQTREADWALQFSSSDRITISRLPLGGYQISRAGSGRSVSVKRVK